VKQIVHLSVIVQNEIKKKELTLLFVPFRCPEWVLNVVQEVAGTPTSRHEYLQRRVRALYVVFTQIFLSKMGRRHSTSDRI